MEGKEIGIIAHVQNIRYHQRRQQKIQQQRQRKPPPAPEERNGEDEHRYDRRRGGDGERHAHNEPRDFVLKKIELEKESGGHKGEEDQLAVVTPRHPVDCPGTQKKIHLIYLFKTSI